MSSNDIVAQANTVLRGLYESCNRDRRYVFGGDMLRGDDSDVIATTICHRILKKFQEPATHVEARLRKECAQAWIDYEALLKTHRFYSQPSSARSVIYRARILLHRWFRNWNPSDVVEFTPGETFCSANGYTSVFQKLSRKKHWCVTPDAADDFIDLCYRTLMLKRCAKKLMHPLTRDQARRIYEVYKNDPRGAGYAIFHHRMVWEVLTFVQGSRSSSVYKDNEKRRFINVEALGNMILQRADAHAVRSVLATVGNSLDDGQLRHRRLISATDVATVDFSNASDSVLREIVRFMFPSNVFKTLDRHRSPYVLIDGVYYEPVKMSSMGNGYTFELMSSLLLAVARVLDSNASVYGDDVIVKNQSAHAFVQAAQAIGFKVNQSKTFIDSRFRESCGAFYLDGHGYVTCYDIHWCRTHADVITSCNKLDRIIRDNPGILPDYFKDAHIALLSLLPNYYRGPRVIMGMGDFPPYAVDDAYRRKHMRDAKARAFHQLMCGKLGSSIRDLQYNIKDVAYIRVPTYVPKLATPTRVDLSDSTAKYASYLYSGMRAPDVRRNAGTWTLKSYVVLPTGLTLAVADLRRHG